MTIGIIEIMGLGTLPFEEMLWFLGLFSWEEGQLNNSSSGSDGRG